MREIRSSIACNLDTNVLLAALPLLEAEKVQAIEWSFDTLYKTPDIPPWFVELLKAFGRGKPTDRAWGLFLLVLRKVVGGAGKMAATPPEDDGRFSLRPHHRAFWIHDRGKFPPGSSDQHSFHSNYTGHRPGSPEEDLPGLPVPGGPGKPGLCLFPGRGEKNTAIFWNN